MTNAPWPIASIAFREGDARERDYPIHIMWESGGVETLGNMLRDYHTDVDDRAGVGEWLKKLRDNLVEAKDRSLEVTLARPGGLMWRENEGERAARLGASGRKGAMQLLTTRARKAVSSLAETTRARSSCTSSDTVPGASLRGARLPLLLKAGIGLRTIQFMAPAITVELFRQLVLPLVEGGKCPHPTNYVLSDAGERMIRLARTANRLLFLVSNAFEGTRGVPLLGMERFVSGRGEMEDRFLGPNRWANEFFTKTVNGIASLVVAGNEMLDRLPGATAGREPESKRSPRRLRQRRRHNELGAHPNSWREAEEVLRGPRPEVLAVIPSEARRSVRLGVLVESPS